MDALKALTAWLRKGPKVSVEPHPDDVIDVHPKVLASMKRRLKQKPTPGARKPKKDMLDDSVHMAPVKKSELTPINLLAIWLAKATLVGNPVSTPMPSATFKAEDDEKPYPKKAASKNIEAHMLRLKKNKAKYPGGRKQAIAIGISQARSGKHEPKPMSKSVDALDAWLSKGGKKKLRKDAPTPPADDDFAVAQAVPMA